MEKKGEGGRKQRKRMGKVGTDGRKNRAPDLSLLP